MKIRFAIREDIHQIVTLCRMHADHEKTNFDIINKDSLLSKHLFDDISLKCLVVEIASEIVGYATFMKQFSTWEADFYLYLDCLFLKEEMRGKGIGALLMDKIKDYAQAEGCTIIQWQTPDFNKKAIQFYQKIGATSKTKERFFLDI